MTKNKKLLRFLIKRSIKEAVNTSDWQYASTANVLDEIGYRDFIKSLPDEDYVKLKNEMAHHLNTALTVVLGRAELGDVNKMREAIHDLDARLKWFLDEFTSRQK